MYLNPSIAQSARDNIDAQAVGWALRRERLEGEGALQQLERLPNPPGLTESQIREALPDQPEGDQPLSAKQRTSVQSAFGFLHTFELLCPK